MEVKYCGKECKNTNSLKQHEVRCRENPNRKAFNNLGNYSSLTRKGKTKFNNSDIAKSSASLKAKYDNGYINPQKGKHVTFEYVHKIHNDQEIQKWLDYTKSLTIIIPNYEVISHGKSEDSYNIIRKNHQIINNTVKVLFEHDYIANLYLNGLLEKENTVHHIDENKKNNHISNLLVFRTTSEHKRFHSSKYAYLTYDSITHMFSCELIH